LEAGLPCIVLRQAAGPKEKDPVKLSVRSGSRPRTDAAADLVPLRTKVKRGVTYGATDDLSYNAAEPPVSLYDQNATLLRCLDINREKFSFKAQGLDQRLTDVETLHVVKAILA
jgi:Protein of unknown function (DUF1501)